MIIFETTGKMKKYVTIEKVKPRARQTRVGRFGKAE
jgi:hypothetical protein